MISKLLGVVEVYQSEDRTFHLTIPIDGPATKVHEYLLDRFGTRPMEMVHQGEDDALAATVHVYVGENGGYYCSHVLLDGADRWRVLRALETAYGPLPSVEPRREAG
jgi:hypothetical protein